MYLVKWRDKPLKDATWETEETLKENRSHMEKYEAKISGIISEEEARKIPIVITIEDENIK